MMVNHASSNNSNQQQQAQHSHLQQHQQQQQQHLTLVGHNANHLLLTSLSAMPNLLAANPVTNLISLNAAQNNNSTSNSNSASAASANLNVVNSSNGAGLNDLMTASSGISQTPGPAVNTGLLDLIMCKLVAPFHVVNDPRLLECGSSACYQCIMSSKDNERNLKCPYCSGVHKIPVDSSKLIVNKNVQNFLKTNSRHINSNFSKQLEDSMFALEQKIHSQNLSMDNFDQYLTLIQNDVQMKVDTMKSYLEKYGQHFIENLKNIRKEVQKQWIEHSQQTGIPNTTRLKTDALFQTNTNVMSMLNNANNQQSYQLNSFPGLNVAASAGSNGNNHHQNPNSVALNSSNDHKNRNSNANNFSNSSSWNANDDDLDDFDAELNLKTGISTGANSKRHLNKEQAQFNKFVREEVAKKFGEDFLLQHEVNQLESSVMELIKSEAISTFLPKDTTPARAWTLAKVSLRSLKRDLRRKQQGMGMTSMTTKKNDSIHDGAKMAHPYFDI